MSEHFPLSELVATSHPDLQDEPSPEVRWNLTRLVADALEPARSTWGVPVHVNSGYRSKAVNQAVGGSATSAHVRGLAADVVPQGLDLQAAYEQLRASGLVLDQAIFEEHGGARWLHLGLAAKGREPRREWLAFTPATAGRYVPYDAALV